MAGKGNQAKGGMQYVKGKIEWMLGKLTHNRSMQARAMGDQAKGGVRYETGKAQGAIDNLTKRDKSSNKQDNSTNKRDKSNNR